MFIYLMAVTVEEETCIETVLACLRNLTEVGVRELCDVIPSLMEDDTPIYINIKNRYVSAYLPLI